MIPQGSWVSPNLVQAMGATKMNQEIGWQSLSTSTPTAAYSTTFSLQVPKDRRHRHRVGRALVPRASPPGPAYQTFVNTNDQAPALSGFTTPANVPTALLANYTALSGSGTSYLKQLFAASYGPFTTYMSEMIDGSATPRQRSRTTCNSSGARAPRRFNLPRLLAGPGAGAGSARPPRHRENSSPRQRRGRVPWPRERKTSMSVNTSSRPAAVARPQPANSRPRPHAWRQRPGHSAGSCCPPWPSSPSSTSYPTCSTSPWPSPTGRPTATPSSSPA